MPATVERLELPAIVTPYLRVHPDGHLEVKLPNASGAASKCPVIFAKADWEMRRVMLTATVLACGCGPALAQTPSATAISPRAQAGVSTDTQRPIDKGPSTPEANGAYQGGGVILQGAPGAHPPPVQPTPSGQTPRNLVPK